MGIKKDTRCQVVYEGFHYCYDLDKDMIKNDNNVEYSKEYEDMCENVDASVFSGDLLYRNLTEFKEYVARWQRAIDEHERAYSATTKLDDD